MAGKPKRRSQMPVGMPVQVPADPRPIKYRVGDLPGLPPEEIARLKADFLRHMRETARRTLSAERAGATLAAIEKLLEDDLRFREDAQHAFEARVDELEMDLEGSTNRSGGDVMARIFMIKGQRPEKYQERIVQQSYQHGVYEPASTFTVLEEKKSEEDPALPKRPTPPAH